MAQDGIELNDQQIAALERKHEDDVACGEIETAHPGYLGAQDTFYVGNLKGVGRIYQQTFIDTYSKVVHCKLYTTKTPITAADLLNDRVLPFYQSQDLPMLRILTDRGTEYCGKVEQHDYELYLAVNDIDHTKTKAASRKQMVYVSVSIRRFCRSSIKLRLGRSFIAHWKNYKLI